MLRLGGLTIGVCERFIVSEALVGIEKRNVSLGSGQQTCAASNLLIEAVQLHREDNMANAAYFADYTKPEFSTDVNFSILGFNTGNEAFVHAISNIIDVDRLSRHKLNRVDELAHYEAFVTSDLIWIRPGTDAPDSVKSLLDQHPHKRIIPISLGLQSSQYTRDFVLSQDMVRTLERVAERAVIAVRGNYTAEILLKNNIRNIEIIGCPSVYQYPFFQRSFRPLLDGRDVRRATGNFRTFYERLTPKEAEILRYFAQNFDGFVEQTKLTFANFTHGSDPAYDDIRSWLEQKESVHFSLEAWVDYCASFDFSMGSRFHGNIAAILAGIKALIIITDTRTQELSEFFSLPSITAAQFDDGLPVADYYDRADFGHFVSDFHNKIARFREFLSKNGLGFSERYINKLESFEFNRIGKPWLS